MKIQRKVSTTWRKAMTVTELAMVILIAGIILGIAFFAVPKLISWAKGNSGSSQIGNVLVIVEDKKNDNGGAYPAQAAATAITSITGLYNALGGANGTKDIAGWTYSCPVGSGQTITIVTSSFESSSIQSSIIDKVNGRYAPWAAAASGTNAVTITKSNVTCQ